MPTAPSFGVTAFKQANRQIIKFGGLAQKVGGTMTYIDLNDQVNWFAQDIQIDNSHIQNAATQRTWLGSGSWTARDFVGRKVDIPMVYDETNGTSFAQAKANLAQAGEQFLTFDNVTGLRCRLNAFGSSHFKDARDDKYQSGGYLIDTSLQFLSKNSFAEDLSSTTVNVGAVAGSVSPGTANNFTQSYSGGFFTPAVYTLTIPNTNTVTISSISLANTASGETVALAFSPVITASVAHTVVIDCSQFQASLDGAFVAPSGSFPMFYPTYPSPASNTMVMTIIASGPTTGLTLSYTFTNRWEF